MKQISQKSDINYLAGTVKVRGDSKQIPSFFVSGTGIPVIPFYLFGVDFRQPVSQERNQAMTFFPPEIMSLNFTNKLLD